MFIGISCIMGQVILLIFTFSAYCRPRKILEVKPKLGNSPNNKIFRKRKRRNSIYSITIPRRISTALVHPSVLYTGIGMTNSIHMNVLTNPVVQNDEFDDSNYFDDFRRSQSRRVMAKKRQRSRISANYVDNYTLGFKDDDEKPAGNSGSAIDLERGEGTTKTNTIKRLKAKKRSHKPLSHSELELNCVVIYLGFYLLLILLVECYVVAVTILIPGDSESKSEHAEGAHSSLISDVNTNSPEQDDTKHSYIKNHLTYIIFNRVFMKLFVFISAFMVPLGQLQFIIYQKFLQKNYFTVILSTNFQIRSEMNRQRQSQTLLSLAAGTSNYGPGRFSGSYMQNSPGMAGTEQQVDRVLEFLRYMRIHNRMTVLAIFFNSMAWIIHYFFYISVDANNIQLEEYVQSTAEDANRYKNSYKLVDLYYNQYGRNYTENLINNEFPEYPFIWDPQSWFVHINSTVNNDPKNLAVYYYSKIKPHEWPVELNLMLCKMTPTNLLFGLCVSTLYSVLILSGIVTLVRILTLYHLHNFNRMNCEVDTISAELLDELERSRSENNAIIHERRSISKGSGTTAETLRLQSTTNLKDHFNTQKRTLTHNNRRNSIDFLNNNITDISILSEEYRERRRSVACLNKVKTDVNLLLRMCCQTCNRLVGYSLISISVYFLNCLYYFFSNTSFELTYTIALINFLITSLALVLCHDDSYEMKKVMKQGV